MELKYEMMNDPQKPENAEGAIELYKRYLNSGKSISQYIYDGIKNPRFCGVVCKDGDRVVAATSARPGIEFTIPKPELEKQIQDRWGTDGVFTGDMVAVDPQYRGYGIASEMSRLFYEDLKKKGCKHMVVEAWYRRIEKDTPCHWTIKYIGTNEIISIDREFYKDIAKFGLTCPECGAECHCGAVISIVNIR